jgi:isocitrate lyase
MVFTKIDTIKEERDYRAEVEEVKRWWTEPRFRKIKRYPSFQAKADMLCRPYTAESVVTKRGSIKIEYASNTQAKKLFALLEEHAKVAHPPILKC